MNFRFLFRCFHAAILVTVAAPTLEAQARRSAVAPEKEAVIRRILEITKTADLMLVAIESGLPAQRASNPNIPAVFWDRFAAKAREQRSSLVDSIIPIYDKHFSTAELKSILQFYQTPIGQRLVNATPDIARESMLAGQRWGFVIGQEIGAQLQREGLVPRPPEP